MAYTKFMITCMLHFRESYPESCPRIIPANHTTNHTHDFNKGGRNIPRNIPPKHTSETYLESYPLMQHALLGTEFSERAIYIYISSPRVFASLFTLCQPLREVASVVGTSIKRLWLQNAKQQDAAGDPISVLNALQGKKLRSLSTMAGKCSQGANKLERGLY